MIAALFLLALQTEAAPAPMSEAQGPAFPTTRLLCTVATADGGSFQLDVKRYGKDPVAVVKSTRKDLFPTGNYFIDPAFIGRQAEGKPINYRVNASFKTKTTEFSMLLKVKDSVVEEAWLREIPPGFTRSDQIREIGSAQCQASAK